VATATESLEAILREPNPPQSLVDAAVRAVGAFGPAGFDALMRFRGDPSMPAGIRNIFLTALAGTGDARALPVLREIIDTPATSDGNRVQAIRALGAVVASRVRSGQSIDSTESSASKALLRRYVSEQTPAQLYGVALSALANLSTDGLDVETRQLILSAIASTNRVRRLAALETLYQCDLQEISYALDTIQTIAETESDHAISEVAFGILERYEAEAQP
jgi:hypothetical protein